MERIELIKEIETKNINNLLQISIDDSLSYIKKSDGINVVGCFCINGSYICNDLIEKNIDEKIEVDMFVKYENIKNSDEFKVYVDDFGYEINSEKLLLKIYVSFYSYKDVDVTFPSDEILEEDTSEPFIKMEEIKGVKSDSVIVKNKKEERKSNPFLECFFNNEKYEKSATFHVLKENETIEDVSKLYGVEADDIKKLNRGECYIKGDLINIPLK